MALTDPITATESLRAINAKLSGVSTEALTKDTTAQTANTKLDTIATNTSTLLKDSTGEAITAKLDKMNSILGLMANKKFEESSDWGEVKKIVTSGNAANIFDYGDRFVDKWTNGSTEYTVPWGVRHFGDFELEDGETVPGMVIQWDYCTPIAVPFSHERAFLRCPNGLAAGTYYFTVAEGSGKCPTGTVICFTIDADVPAGGCIAGLWQAPDADPANWRVYVYAADHKTRGDAITPVFEATEGAVNLGSMNRATRNGDLNSLQEAAYGWNRWKYSALRQWLNSAKPVGQWWTPQDDWDIAPTQLTQYAGFLAGLPEDLLACIKPTKVTTYTNTVNDGGECDITYDKIFVPSLEQMYCVPQISGEGTAWEYWKRASQRTAPCVQYGTYPQMITYAVENHSSAQSVALRSAYRGGAYGRWGVYSSGSFNGYGACYALRCAPACVLA